MGKYTFEDVFIKKLYGEAKECDGCNGSGIVQYVEKCSACDGNGFILESEKETP